jgi:prepilin-type N-terminal cleavage/methylation domain-containing protein
MVEAMKTVARRRRLRSGRAGFSLLEMMLATAVLLGCVVVLGELAGIGNQHVDDIAGLSLAEVICQSTLNEMLSGAAAVESFEGRAVPEHAGWTVSAEVTSTDRQGVASLRVTAWYEDPQQVGAEQAPVGKHAFALVRWIRDPYSPVPGEENAGGLTPFSLMDQIGGGMGP